MLLGSLKGLKKDFQGQFGKFEDRFEDEIKFWDNFFEKEQKNKTFIYGNDSKELEKRFNIPTRVEQDLNFLKQKRQLNSTESSKENYSISYKYSHIEAPNNVFREYFRGLICSYNM